MKPRSGRAINVMRIFVDCESHIYAPHTHDARPYFLLPSLVGRLRSFVLLHNRKVVDALDHLLYFPCVMPKTRPRRSKRKMASLLSRLNPVPYFPAYTGPYRVGTVDVELEAGTQPSAGPSPDPAISTVSFRIFYPCEIPKKAPKPVYWIPPPQHEVVSAYARFLGASSRLAQFIA